MTPAQIIKKYFGENGGSSMITPESQEYLLEDIKQCVKESIAATIKNPNPSIVNIPLFTKQWELINTCMEVVVTNLESVKAANVELKVPGVDSQINHRQIELKEIIQTIEYYRSL